MPYSLIVLITSILAFCSIVYELLVAQTLTATLGGTVLRYNITIGFYIASLGFGVIFYRSFNFKDAVSRLINVEIILSVIGTLSPFYILFVDKLARVLSDSFAINFEGFLIQSLIFLLDYALIISIGFLSGFELPLLMDIGDKFFKKLSIKVLAVDYIGSMIGAIAFAIILLPNTGVFLMAAMTGLLNIVCALSLCSACRKKDSTKLSLLSLATASVIFLLFIYNNELQDSAIAKFYLAN